MMNKKRLSKILWVLLTIPLVSVLLLYTRLPEKMPIHWNINGEIDQYVPKFIGAFFIPILCIIFLFAYIPCIPKASYNKSSKIYNSIAGIMSVIFLVLHFAVLGISLGADFLKMDFIAKFVVGIAIMLFGNLIPKLKPNEESISQSQWMTKGQRHGGYVWFVSGCLFIILAFIPGTVSAILYFSLILVISIEPILYSYLRYGRNTESI